MNRSGCELRMSIECGDASIKKDHVCRFFPTLRVIWISHRGKDSPSLPDPTKA